MKITLGTFPEEYDRVRLIRMARDVEIAFERVEAGIRRTYAVTLNFAAPGAVPGFTDQVVSVSDVEMSDTVIVGAPVAPPAGFLPPVGFVSAANQITVRWAQLAGAAADPDGGGGTYNIDVFRH